MQARRQEIGIEVKADTPVEPEKPTVEKVEIKANPAKTDTKQERHSIRRE